MSTVPVRSATSARRAGKMPPAIVAATRIGGIAVIYVTGLGATQPAAMEGAAAPLNPLARTAVQPIVRIAGQPAVVEFSGLVPGYAGLYQVNAQIPAETEPGEQSLSLTINGVRSNVVKIGVR